MGEYDHNTVQMQVTFWFHHHRKEWNVRAVFEQRTLLTPRRVRIPDFSVFRRSLPIEEVFTYPQLIAIELLSPEDRQSRLRERIQDFIDFGVESIWVIDPEKRNGWDYSDANWTRQERFEADGSAIYLSMNELFGRIDADQAG